MCGIIGFYHHKNAKKLVEKGLKIIKDRGIDGQGIIGKGDCYIGHVLHAIVSKVNQPFKEKDEIFAINGEIYNWEELKSKHNIKARNDSELVFKLIQKEGIEIIDELDGVYAFVYQKGDLVYLARDIIGVKPLWFSLDENLAFCSEKKALNLNNIEELNPRIILKYNITEKTTEVIKRKFFDIFPEHTENHKQIIKKVKELTLDAIKKRIPDKPFGILFSGGIDSTFIALVCKQMGLDFTCYTASLKGEIEAPDLAYSKKVAEKLDLKLKYKEVELDKIPNYLKKVVPLIEDSNVVKVGVGLTFYIACELARKDNIKVIFSGLGSEELFAGYERHKRSQNINEECLSGVRKIYERDLYRDDVITMNNNLELRLPFLDKNLTDYALKIPAKYKLSDYQSKIILRDVAKVLKLDHEFSERPKKAAQYGSKFDKALEKLTKKDKLKYKSEYLKQFYKVENLKLAALISGGKDSFYAMHIMQKQNYEVTCFVTIKSENPHSYMYHTPNIDLVQLQAKACEIPLIEQKTKGEKEAELKDLEIALIKAKEKHGVQGVTVGALFSNYQRTRVEKICDKLNLKIFTPLWHMDQELELRNLIDEDFKFIFSSIAAYGLDKSWLNREITNTDVDVLAGMKKTIGSNVAGEGGEYETLVLDAPMFKKSIKITSSKIDMENEITGKVDIKGAELICKGY